jgi:hypothetical protein
MNLINLTGIEITVEDAGANILSVMGISPNPVMNSLFFSASIPSGALSVTIFDLSGRRIDQFDVEYLESGDYRLNLEVPAGAPNGVYMLIVESGSQIAGLRFTVLR